jgi:ankyrin repeat protein
MTSLHHACISGSVEIVSLLLECGSKIDVKDVNGYRPLHYACQYGKVEIGAALLRYGANPNEPTLANNDSPMHLLIQHSPLTSSASTSSMLDSNTPLNSHEKLLMILLSHSGIASLSIANNSQQMTPFELACELGKTKMIEIIIKYLLNNQNDHSDLIRNHSKNSLHLACKNAHDEIIRMLLIYNLSDINYANDEGTALHEACRYGRYQTAKLLLESGIDLNIQDKYKQLAVDVIIKQKIGNDLKCLLKGNLVNFILKSA